MGLHIEESNDDDKAFCKTAQHSYTYKFFLDESTLLFSQETSMFVKDNVRDSKVFL